MSNMNPNTVLDITWSDRFRPVLATLNSQLQAGTNRHVYFYTRALLTMLREGRTQIRTADVAERVRVSDAPRGGWILWDQAKWCNYGLPVVAALKSADPMSVLNL
jgi:hypothetical protein